MIPKINLSFNNNYINKDLTTNKNLFNKIIFNTYTTTSLSSFPADGNPLSIKSNLFHVDSTDQSIFCETSIFSFYNYIEFFKGFSMTYPARINQSNNLEYIFLTIRIFISIYCIHNSSFVFWLYSNQLTLNIPPFLHAYLHLICSKVRSTNKSLGYTYGEINTKTSLHDIITWVLCDLKLGGNKSKIIEVLLMSGAINTRKDSYTGDYSKVLFDKFSLAIQNLDYSSNFSIQQFLFAPFLNVKNIITDDSYECIPSTLRFEESTSLGIYRFRKSEFTDCYIVNQNNTLGIKLVTLELFASFLHLFSPSFYMNGKIQPSLCMGQEVLVNFYNISRIIGWNFIFNIHIRLEQNNRAVAPRVQNRGGHNIRGLRANLGNNQLQEALAAPGENRNEPNRPRTPLEPGPGAGQVQKFSTYTGVSKFTVTDNVLMSLFTKGGETAHYCAASSQYRNLLSVLSTEIY
jgi:hypothetical protein